jgi:DNA-binding NarL/FixJ family response regulator
VVLRIARNPATDGLRDVIPAVRALAGGKPFHSPLSGAVINPADLDGHRTTLADREPEILTLLAQGKTNKQVAAALDVSL